jgi:hypothetical protein
MKTIYKKIKYKYFLFAIAQLFRFFSKRPSMIENPHFFIIGSGRNGSTLLATILNAHKEIIIPSEQFVLPYATIRRYIFFFWTDSRWVKNVKSLITNTEKTIKWDIDVEGIISKGKDVSFLFNNIFNAYKDKYKPESKIWGDKSPLNTNFIKYIYPEFPDAKYIFLIRDPRDVALSYRKYLGSGSFKFGIWKWKDSVRSYDYLLERTDVLLVKYENLVESPNNEIGKITDFLNLSKDDSIAKYKVSAEKMGVEEDSHHQNLKNPISPRSVGKWKNELSEKDLSYFKMNIKIEMQRFGYDL